MIQVQLTVWVRSSVRVSVRVRVSTRVKPARDRIHLCTPLFRQTGGDSMVSLFHTYRANRRLSLALCENVPTVGGETQSTTVVVFSLCASFHCHQYNLQNCPRCNGFSTLRTGKVFFLVFNQNFSLLNKRNSCGREQKTCRLLN